MRKRWYSNAFDAVYVDAFKRLFTRRLNRVQSLFIRRELRLTRGMEVLDAGCGYGRHSIELAKLGLRVLALDQSRAMLDAATQQHGVSYLHRDILDVDWVDRFDGIYWSSFGYLSRRESELALRRLGLALKVGGRILIGVSLKDWWQQNPTGQRWVEVSDGMFVLSSHKYFPGSDTYVARTTILRRGYSRPEYRESRGHVFALEDWPKFAAKSGLVFEGIRSTDSNNGRKFLHVLLKKPK